MTWSTRMRWRGVLMVAALALVLALALSACGGSAAPNVTGNGATGGQTTSGQTQSTGGNSAAQDLQNGDQQVQGAVSAMDSAQNDASIDLSGQDTEVQP